MFYQKVPKCPFAYCILNTKYCILFAIMRIDVLTLFPGMFEGPLTESIVQRAREADLLDIRLHDLREFGLGKHRQIDDKPYGGGAGMLMRADVLVEAIESLSPALRATPLPSGEGLGVRAKLGNR